MSWLSLSRIKLLESYIDKVEFGYWGDNGQFSLMDGQGRGITVSFSETAMSVFRTDNGENSLLGLVSYVK